MKGKSVMKNQNTICIAVVLALAFALAPVTQATPDPGGIATREAASDYPCPQWGCGQQLPVISIHSTGNVLRGKTASFVLDMKPATMFGLYVNFKVSGTAVAGVDYVPLLSPAYIGQSGYGTILVHTLADPRGSANLQAYSVVVTLEPGAGYALGSVTTGQTSATIWIKP